MDDRLQIFLLVVFVLLSGFFSSVETAFSTCNRIKLKNLSNRGDKKAARVLKMLEDYDRLITTILIGNNIVNIAAATVAASLFTARYGEDAGSTLSTIVMTLIILVFGEITPKSLANRYADSYSMTTGSVTHFFEILFWPLSWVFIAMQRGISRMGKKKPDDKDVYTNDELITMVDEVEKEGEMEADEGELVRSAIEFNDLDVRDVITPRVRVIAVGKDWGPKRIKATFENNPFSRLPVYVGDIDHIVGFIHEKDFFIALDSGEEFSIDKILRPLLVVPLSYSMLDALQMMQKNKTHLAVVVDEYGGTEGIVTMEDILEELVGEIWDEHDRVEQEMVQINENTWEFSGTCSLVDMMGCFRMHEDDADKFDSDTVGGFVCEILERMPRRNEVLQYEDLTVRVLDVNSRAVKKVRVQQSLPKEEEKN